LNVCSCRVLSKTEENIEKYFLKRYEKNKKSGARYEKTMKFRHARTCAKFSSSRARRKKLCIDESSSNL
jgi:hypothetical protein